MAKLESINMEYRLRVAGLDNVLNTAPISAADFDSLVKGMKATQDAETGVISFAGSDAAASLNPYTMAAEFTRIFT